MRIEVEIVVADIFVEQNNTTHNTKTQKKNSVLMKMK